jgi:hypothetical protein
MQFECCDWSQLWISNVPASASSLIVQDQIEMQSDDPPRRIALQMHAVLIFGPLFAAEAQRTIWQLLDEATRGRLALTLIGFVLLLGLIILLIALSARMMRRLARHKPSERPREISDWDRREPADDAENQ